eukprot:UN04955
MCYVVIMQFLILLWLVALLILATTITYLTSITILAVFILISEKSTLKNCDLFFIVFNIVLSSYFHLSTTKTTSYFLSLLSLLCVSPFFILASAAH